MVMLWRDDVNYYQQMAATLPEQARRYRRLHGGHIFSFFVIDILMFGTLLVWLLSQPNQPLWKVFVVSVVMMLMVCWNLWWAMYYERALRSVQETQMVVTRCNHDW